MDRGSQRSSHYCLEERTSSSGTSIQRKLQFVSPQSVSKSKIALTSGLISKNSGSSSEKILQSCILHHRVRSVERSWCSFAIRKPRSQRVRIPASCDRYSFRTFRNAPECRKDFLTPLPVFCDYNHALIRFLPKNGMGDSSPIRRNLAVPLGGAAPSVSEEEG